jgi:hypothetical protein
MQVDPIDVCKGTLCDSWLLAAISAIAEVSIN